MIKKSAVALAALTACGSALADPVSLFNAVALWYGKNMLLAHVAMLLVTTAYTSSQARRAQRKAAAEARARHNESLEDRSITFLTSSPAHRTVYGRCIVGGDIVAVFTTDKQGLDAKGRNYTKKDGYKHVVVRIADHEVEAIHGAYWGGVKVGPLSVIGDPTYSEGNGGIPVGQTATTGWSTVWTEEREAIVRGDTKLPYKAQSLISAVDTSGTDRLSLMVLSSTQRRVTGPNYEVKLKYLAVRDDFVNGDTPITEIVVPSTTTSYTLPGVATVVDVVSAWYYTTNGDSADQGDVPVTVSTDRRTIYISSPVTTGTVTVSYTVRSSESKLKFSFHRGSPDQVPDAYLMSIIPEKWTANHLLEGKAYAVVTFDLEDPRFQGGPNELSFDVSGKRLWDPRISTYVFSRNNALVANDYLRMEAGVNVTEDDIEQSYLIAAANACDVENTFTETDPKWGTVKTVTGPLYTFNGLVTSEEGKEAVLAGIAQSMAGSIVDSSQWLIIAGAWTPPVMDLTEDDLFGQIEVVQGDNGAEDTFNGVRGRYTPAGLTQPTDITPYVNETLVTADGAPLYDNLEFKYTDSNARCVNLARIHTELSRTGLVIKFPAKTSAWPLQIGDRVRVKTSPAEFGFDFKKFRVTDWQHTLQAPVLLTLQEDEPETYDTIDTALADPTQDVLLPNPWAMSQVEGVTIESGTAHLILNSSGGITVRALVSWDEPSDPYIANGKGYVEVWYRAFTSEGVPETTWTRAPRVQGQNSTYTGFLTDKQLLEVQIYAVNSIGVQGPSKFLSHLVVGQTEPPSDVTGLSSSVNQGVIPWQWDYPPDLDYDATEIRTTDSDWGSLTEPPLWRGRASGWAETVTFAGTFTRYFRHLDRGGRVSVNTATHSQAVSVGDLGPDVTTFRLDISPVSGVLYTDYRGVVVDFTTANASVKVKKSDGTDDTSHWTLTKVDSDINTTLTSLGALSVNSFAAGTIDERYYGSVLRAPYVTGMQDMSKWSVPVTQMAGSTVTFSSTGGPFTGSGYVQTNGSGGSATGLRYSPNTVFITGFNTSWSMSAWIYLTEYGNTGASWRLLGVGDTKELTLNWPTSTTYSLYGRFFGVKSAGGSSSLDSYQVATNTPALSRSGLPLNTWVFLEVTWNAPDKTIRLFQDGVLKASALADYDLATYLETYPYFTGASFYVGTSAQATQAASMCRFSDVDYTFGGSVNTAAYTRPNALRSVKTALTRGSTLVTATSGSTVLEGTYSIATVETAAAVIQVSATRSSGVVKADWADNVYDVSGASVGFQILVNGRNDTNNWTMFVTNYSTTASISYSSNNTTKTIAVSGITQSTASINVYFTNPLYPSQYFKFDVVREKDPKPAQTSTVNRNQITLAGDYNGVATDYSNAVFQAVMREGGEVASGWSWSVSVTSGITYTHSSGLVTITAMAADVDQGEITLTATKSGWVTTTFRCPVVKTKVLLPSGAVVVNIPQVSVFSSQSGTASADIRFRNSGVIESRLNGGSYTSRGRWFNPTGGTPGNSYSAFFGGVWYDLTTDFVLSASSTGDGNVDEKLGSVLFAATSNKSTILGTCPVYLYTYVTPSGG